MRYYNKAGTEITGQFAANGQEKIHQHFFISSKGDIRDYMAYRYADTDPWNKTTEQGAQLLTANPHRPKGYCILYQEWHNLSCKNEATARLRVVINASETMIRKQALGR